ncbi:MAG: glycosyltransferase [Paracoccus sp. (in: a-proteobacteria)]|uniref:glycosyltransferase n=1 Tax=Paracoccus sp. TaxID=267 RepID=UPI0026DEB205|nr:glycosyltransferase [Paracoccus sp. (in: a-proteobacteria)]MDO5621119.1 glycosyltransferase [Paracoccus sp. (in: a-proteobacteria)]
MTDSPAPASRRAILLILGMHRSGTSFLADCAGALGFTLPLDRGGPAADNARGHFEPQAMVHLNDDLLSSTGWERVGQWTPPALDPRLAARLDQALDASYGDAARVVMKDPRLSLTLPLWRTHFAAQGADMVALIALRDPREVADSLASRDDIQRDFAMLLWLAYTLRAFAGSSELPRMTVLFPDWVADPTPVLHRIATLTGIDLPKDAVAEIAARFAADQVHARPEPAAAPSPIETLAVEIFETLRPLAADGTLPDAKALAAWQARFDTLAAPVLGAERSHTRALTAAQEQNRRLTTLRDDALARAGQTAKDFNEVHSTLLDTEAQRDFLQSQLADRLHDFQALQHDLTATETQRDEVTAVLSDTRNLLTATETQRDEVTAILHDTRDRLSQTEAASDRHYAEWETAVAHLDRRQAELETALTHLHNAQAQNDFLAERLRIERMTILKPIYRRIYGFGGRALRRIAPPALVEALRRRLPQPGGIPGRLAFTPLPETTAPAQAFDIPPPRSGDKPDVFVFSIINWDFRTQRPQYLATEMARAGHRVFFVEMEQDHGPGSAREVASNVHVIRLSQQGVRHIQPYTGVPTPRQARGWIDNFHALCDQIHISPTAHVVVEHPFWWHFVKHLAPRFRITFDCMDDIGGFSNTEQHVLDAEMEMIAKADKMFVSSQYLFDRFSQIRDVVMVRNGTDVSHFIREPEIEPIPDFLQGKLADGKIHVGYVGAIAEWFDVDMLEAVARDNPDFDIHLCGAVTAEAPLRLEALPNITMHGEIPYKDVPAFLKAMDVLIIPFQLLPIIKACDPVKFYEYSAVMRPTVATALPELERACDLVITAHDATDFAAGIRQAAERGRNPDFGPALRQYALDNAWSFRAADMLAEMERMPLLSVVVLAYGDPELTLATLYSMTGLGEIYPNLEIIVSDNGSPENALEQLRAVARADSRIRLIENGENLGFAAGNNVGIKAARGEYVLLLNNDTFVAPDALHALVGHLARNPELGIVGPMTNNIGNEARVEVAYADMTEMARIARDLATGHRDQHTPMKVAAYFCALFRRADLERIGDLPTVYGRGMFEDDDHCTQFRAAGLEIALAEDAFVHHHLSATFNALPSAEKQALFDKNKAIFESRWGKWVPHVYRDSRPEGTLPDRA